MPVNLRMSARYLVSCTAFTLVLVTGCATQEPPPASPTPTTQPAPAHPGATAEPAPSPSQDLKELKQELKDVKKAVTPPVIIKPDAPAAPGKAG